jgi:AcrR family transcriptional regulator
MSEDDVDRRSEVRNAAAALFRRHGYHQTSMQQIADDVGLLKGSLYHHYRSKEDILYEISREPLQDLVTRATSIAQSDADTSTKIAELIRSHIEALSRSYPELMIITAETDETLPDRMREDIGGLRRSYQSIWRGVVAKGIESGELRKEFPPTILANFAIGAINWMTRWYDPMGPATPQMLSELLAMMVLGGAATIVKPNLSRKLSPSEHASRHGS